MARRRSRAPLDVFLNGRHVGRLERAISGAIEFRYAAEWLDWHLAMPVSLSLPLREDRYVGDRVINVFDNLLPDSPPIRRRVAERVDAGGVDAFSLLTALGHDCVGALQFVIDGTDPGHAGGTEGQLLSEDQIGGILANLASAPLGVGPDQAFRISIAGAQEKTAFMRKEGSWFKPIGMAATTHILKPQIGLLPNGIDFSESVENEHFCLKVMKAFGLRTAASEIIDFGGIRALVVERFDRLWTDDGRLLRCPQEDICQALSVPSTRKYESDGGPGMRDIIALLKGSDTPNADIAVFLKSAIVFWLLGATDGHAKNFSLALGPGGRFNLAPLYDVLTTQPNVDARQIERKTFRLALSAGRKRHYAVEEIMPRHFAETANSAGVETATVQAIAAEVAANAVRIIEDVAAGMSTSIPDSIIDPVVKAVTRRARLLATAPA